ncbi:MAG: hypothetical protein V3571_12845 [Pseudodesulfovibrio sp.]
MHSRRRSKDRTREQVRNIILIILAVGMVIVFFNLDTLRKGESVFSKSADRKLRFAGKLDRKDYAASERDRLLAFIKRNDKDIQAVTIRTSTQDAYGAVAGATPILFEIRMEMTGGAVINAPVRRSDRLRLTSAILEKLNKDMRTYRSLREQGKDVNSLMNVM